MAKKEGQSTKTRLETIGATRPWEALAVDFTFLDHARDGKREGFDSN